RVRWVAQRKADRRTQVTRAAFTTILTDDPIVGTGPETPVRMDVVHDPRAHGCRAGFRRGPADLLCDRAWRDDLFGAGYQAPHDGTGVPQVCVPTGPER